MNISTLLHLNLYLKKIFLAAHHVFKTDFIPFFLPHYNSLKLNTYSQILAMSESKTTKIMLKLSNTSLKYIQTSTPTVRL